MAFPTTKEKETTDAGGSELTQPIVTQHNADEGLSEAAGGSTAPACRRLHLKLLLLALGTCAIVVVIVGWDELTNGRAAKPDVPSHAIPPWWKTSTMYQVYPRSFKDSSGDGTGDINGITMQLDYLRSIGVGMIWLSPVMASPMADFGYDISNFEQIDPLFGSMEDMKTLIKAARQRGIRILMDFVPNHTSNTSEWFISSRSSKSSPKRDWYVWHPGLPKATGGRPDPPNNWASNFGGGLGSSWTWDEGTGEYYYHAFGSFQPDLNYSNPEVVKAMQQVLEFWLDLGVSGFRIDAVPFLLEDPLFRNESVDENCARHMPIWSCMNHSYTQIVPGIHSITRGWRTVLDRYDEAAMFGEIYAPIQTVMSFYGTETEPEFHVPFNFGLIGADYGEPQNPGDAEFVRDTIRTYSMALRQHNGAHGNWVLGNHDNHRLMDRVDNSTVTATALYCLVLLLPGTPTIYNGDEIAMRDLYIPYSQCQDPMCIRNPRDFAAIGRDPERTPMQWDTSNPQAGFSTNPDTWLPVNPDYTSVNVQLQNTINGSALSVFRRAAEYRRANTWLALGNIAHVAETAAIAPVAKDDLVAVTVDISRGSLGEGIALIVANLDATGSLNVPNLAVLLPQHQRSLEMRWSFSTHGRPVDRGATDVAKAITLFPGEVGVLLSIS